MKDRKKHKNFEADQGLAAWIEKLNHERRVPLYQALDELQGKLNHQDELLRKSLSELDWVKSKIDTPENIIGSDETKHGEVAELADVGVRNAKRILHEKFPDAIWGEGTDRTGPADYAIGGEPVQSKFINGINNGLRAIKEHAERYPNFGSEEQGSYAIPADQKEFIDSILKGNNHGFNTKTINAVKQHVAEIENLKGKSFQDLVHSSEHNYSEVQQGKIHETLNRQESRFSGENERLKEEEINKNRSKIADAQQKAAPNIKEMGKVAGYGAAIGGGLQFTLSIYQKWKNEGKSPTQLNTEDWKDLGIKTSTGALSGGVSAASIYVLTNYSALSAPMAGAIVSSGRSLAMLASNYSSGEIDYDEFVDLSLILTSEAGATAVGAALGQTAIPIPVLGALIGSASGRIISVCGKEVLGKKAEEIESRLEEQFQENISHLNNEHKRVLADLDASLLELYDLTTTAFQINLNAYLIMLRSIQLSEAHGVPDQKILRNANDVDSFIFDS